jgi:NAD(P)-dependent dehydrogenase (short-subunit alcohol dehydrogenase family)
MEQITQSGELMGKVAVITGGLGLLGYQHSRALLALGAKVVIWDISLENKMKVSELLQSEFPDGLFEIKKIDVAKEESVEKASLDLESIDILINNAAINPKYEELNSQKSRLENMTIEDWNFQLSIGLTGSFLCSKHLGQRMANAKSGIIVNIASDLSVISPDQRLYRKNGLSEEMQSAKPVTYSVIKTGLIGLTRYLATYWAEQGVRVNALSPGGVLENQTTDFQSELKTRIPMARLAHQDEYIGAIQFLCTERSSYMTGQNLIIDGGRSIW